MISFEVNSLYVLDLKDDFIMNEKLKLHEFLNKDPVKAFYLGMNISEWFDQLDKKQQYLHSKPLRHNQEEIEPYREQMKYWAKLFPDEGDQVNVIELSEFVINNMIWYDEDTEDTDRTKMALFLGMIAGKESKTDETHE